MPLFVNSWVVHYLCYPTCSDQKWSLKVLQSGGKLEGKEIQKKKKKRGTKKLDSFHLGAVWTKKISKNERPKSEI